MSTRTDDPGTERNERPAPPTDGGSATYRTLDEQAGRLSPTEERFERRRVTAGCGWRRCCSSSSS